MNIFNQIKFKSKSEAIEYLFANLCEYFKKKIMQMMRINGVWEYTKICQYEANKIHICLALLQSE
jgi:hypothetical protein